ncbi:MAG: hypothetical protein ACE5IR_21580 [bacterium]
MFNKAIIGPRLSAYLFLHLAILLNSSRSDAGAWTQKKGHFYSKFGLLRFESTSQYRLNGNRETLSDNGRVLDVSVYSYLEYGIFDDLTFIASLPFKRISFSCAIEDCGNTSTGFGDVFWGLRYRLSQTDWIVSIQSGLKIALGYETDEEALDSAPPIGDGQTDIEFRLQLGRSLFNYNGYVTIDAGYRGRGGEPVDEIPFAFEIGVDLTKDYVLIGRVQGVRSITEKEGQNDFRIVDGQVVNFIGTGSVEDFVKVNAQLIYHMTSKFDLSFEFEQTLAGRNTSHATIFGGGIAFHK